MRTLQHKIPPPIVMFCFAVLMWFVAKLGGIYLFEGLIGYSIVCLLLAGASIFIFSGLHCFRKSNTTVNPLDPAAASTLVTSGIYQITRNPMYVGLTLLLLAWACYLSSIFSLLCVGGFILYIHYFQIRPEERILKDLFGDNYDDYQSKVRRWL